MVLNVTKTSQKMENINWLSIEKNITEWEKTLYCNYDKIFSSRKFCFFIRKSIRSFFLLCLCLKSIIIIIIIIVIIIIIIIIIFWFLGLVSSFLKYKIFKLVARNIYFLKYKKRFKSGVFFVFWARRVTSWNIWRFSGLLFPET